MASHRGHADDCIIHGQAAYSSGPCDCGGITRPHDNLLRNVVREMHRRGYDILSNEGQWNQHLATLLFARSDRARGKPFLCYPIEVTGLEQIENEGSAAEFAKCRVNAVLSPEIQPPVAAAIDAIHSARRDPRRI